MRSFTRLIVFTLLLCPAMIAARTQASSQEAQSATGSVTGRATVGGRPVAGVAVLLMPSFYFDLQAPLRKGTTDADGKFKIDRVPAGRYYVRVVAPAFVVANESTLGQTITVTEGETVSGLELALKSGGVITGRVTYANGLPVIGRVITLSQPNPASPMRNLNESLNPPVEMMTDDRGIYRVFGVKPGRYLVSVSDKRCSSCSPTYHPGVTDKAQATTVDMSETGEATGIDIKLPRVGQTYEVSGRVVDAETGQPVPNIQLERVAQSSRSTRYYVPTNAEGEFRFIDLAPGSYTITTSSDRAAEFFIPAFPFEVVNQDLTELEISAQRGGTISGVMVIEGTDNPAIVGDLSRFQIWAYDRSGHPSTSAQVQANGQFRLAGLSPGTFRLSFSFSAQSLPPNSFRSQRFEHNGTLLKTNEITIVSGEDVTGLRVVLAYAPNIIRGRVQIIGGPLPAGTTLVVGAAYPVGSNVRQFFSAEVDPRGNFVIDGLVAGEYEVSVVLRPPPGAVNAARPPRAQQHVTLVNGVEAVITLTLQLNEKEPRP